MRRFVSSRRLTQILTAIAVVSVLVAWLIPPVQWVSDGEIRVPVKVFVFDAVGNRPISNAECLVFRSLPAWDADMVSDFSEQGSLNSPIDSWPEKSRAITDATGICVIEHSFLSTASDRNPKGSAHLMFSWVRVEAIGYGGVVVPVRFESRQTSKLRKEGEILAPIGLMPTK